MSSPSIDTATRMIIAAYALRMPIHVAGGSSPTNPLCFEIQACLSRYFRDQPTVERKQFSMAVSSILSLLPTQPAAIAIVGMQAHIEVLQTALDLLRRGYRVYVLTDGIGCRSQEERIIALERLGREGAVMTTSESWTMEVLGGRDVPGFDKFEYMMQLYLLERQNVAIALRARQAVI